VIWTWLDILLAAIVVAAVIIGLFKGLIREVLGLIAAVLGLIAAGQYYPSLAVLIRTVITNQEIAAFVSFLLIFVAVVVVGWVVGGLLSKAVRGPFKFFNHLLGGAFGFLKGVLIAGVVVLALLVFSVDRPTVTRSELAPYALTITSGIVQLVPQELKARFKAIYRDIKGKVGKHGQEG
jgi:membrane protein required for colicin V production